MKAKTAQSLDAWRAELQKFRPADDADAMTTLEIAQASGRSLRWVYAYIKQEMAAGRMKQTTKLVARGAGRYPAAAYAKV